MHIHEFPSIKIDDFTLRLKEPVPQLCFLTHMHEDHTKGLTRKSYYGPYVYCTATTRTLLLNYRAKREIGDLKYSHLRREVCGKDIIRALELDKPYELPYFSTTIEITLIDANHCPGAAMILIKPKSSEGTAVLYTGDLRCEKWHLNMILHKPALLPYVKAELSQEEDATNVSVKSRPQLLSMYVDNTYESHANPYKEYPENYAGIKSLINLLASYPPEVSFCLADGCSGYEEVLILISEHLRSRVHVSRHQYSLYMLAADTSPLAATLLGSCTTDLLDKDEGPVRIHFCQRNPACPCRDPMSATVFFKPCNQPRKGVVLQQNQPLLVKDVPQNVMIPLGEGSRIFKGPSQRYYYDKNTQQFFPLFPWFYFSRHASYPEIQNLCAAFNTCSVRTLNGETLSLSHGNKSPIEQATQTGCSLSLLLSTSEKNQSELQHERSIIDFDNSKRVISLIGGGLQESETLPIMRKRKKIPLHYDRQKKQHYHLKKLQAYRGKFDKNEDLESSSYDSSDEERGHQAMMFIGNQNSRRLDRLKWHNSFVENERRLNSSLTKPTPASSVLRNHCTLEDPVIGRLIEVVDATEIDPSTSFIYLQRKHFPFSDAQGRVYQRYLDFGHQLRVEQQPKGNKQLQTDTDSDDVHNNLTGLSSFCDKKTTQGPSQSGVKLPSDADSNSSLPSPPSTTGFEPNLGYVDETPQEVGAVRELTERLRENPQLWFVFQFDCLSN